MIRRPPRSTLSSSSAASDVYKRQGVNFEQCFDELNLTDPDLIADIHTAYVLAGADILQTNTFGANRFKLTRHGLEDQVASINKVGVELARGAIVSAKDARPVLVAGDIGPLGVRIAPYGRVQPEQALQAFVEQINSLATAGVDLLMIETISDLYEIVAAIQAAKEVRTDLNIHLPICASMTFTRDDRTLLGLSLIHISE